jgi:hypothetical protein
MFVFSDTNLGKFLMKLIILTKWGAEAAPSAPDFGLPKTNAENSR